MERCGKHDSRYLVETNKCCAHAGMSASLLAFESDEKWVPRIEEFNKCTGARVSLTYLDEGEDGMAEALIQDIGTSDESNSGDGIFDAYIVQGPWIPDVQGGLENLSPRITAVNEYVRYQDINPASRSTVSFNGTTRALPLDTDYIALGWRQDVFKKHGLPLTPPKTIEELADLSERLNGLDHNEDGIPDWGFCLTPQVNYFMAFVAPVYQTNLRECGYEDIDCTKGKQTGQNIFFDTDNFQPLVRLPGFEYAFKQYWRLIRSSNCQDQLPRGVKCSRKTAFPTGRCAGVISMPGTMNNLLLDGGKFAVKPRKDPNNSTNVWRAGWNLEKGEYWGRRAVFPGSRKVQQWVGGTSLVDCDQNTCPHAKDNVNYAPFFSEGGEAYALNGRQSKQTSKDVMFDLFTWLAELPITKLPLSGQYRKSQLNEKSGKVLLDDGWPQVMVDDLFNVLGEYFKDEDEGGNPVQDLLMVGFSKYMDVLDNELHDKLLLNSIENNGFFNLKQPNSSIDCEKDSEYFNRRFQDFVTNVETRYNKITDEQISGGRIGQLQRWRQSLNLPWRSPTEICIILLENVDHESFKNINCAAIVDFKQLCQSIPEAIERYEPNVCAVPGRGGIIAAIVIASVLGALLIGLLIYYGYNRLALFRRISARHERLMEETIDESLRSVSQLEFPLHLVKRADFIKEGMLQRHEIMRDQHKLLVIDSLAEVDNFMSQGNPVIFFSHQWTSFSQPDPSGSQYRSMVNALQQVAEQNEWDEHMDNIYVWVDFSCIPQTNPCTQNLAIRSLAAYASSAAVFIIVAPPCNHAELNTACDIETYQCRMWCRAEQVCHSMRNGTGRMFIAHDESHTLKPVDDDWFREALRVFDGDLTCCRLEHKGSVACDRQSLVIPILGLYGELYRASLESHKMGDSSVQESVKQFLNEIEKDQEAIFPRSFEMTHWRSQKRVTETVMLFGDLIERMKVRIEQGGEVSDKDSTTVKSSVIPSGFVRHGVTHGMATPMVNMKVETAIGKMDMEDIEFMNHKV